MAHNVTEKLIHSHLVNGTAEPGHEIGLRIDQTLTQDATGTMVMLELESLGLDRIQTELSVQYVDHNLLQTDEKNPDDHLFLQSAAERFGLWFSKAGNGVSHPVHQARFGRPGVTMIGSDSHTCAAGAIGMLAIGAGGLEIAMAMAGDPLYVQMPEVWGVELTGQLPDWVSAKDVILEMLRRHGVKGGTGRVVEYYGEGLKHLTAMDRHVIANMGAELGATTSVFPADDVTREFFEAVGRPEDFTELTADEGATYDVEEHINLSELEPLIAYPSSPGNVIPVREAAGEDVFQVVVGSSANPGLRDFAIVAEILRGRQTHDQVSLDINPTSREILMDLTKGGWTFELLSSGARLHQSGCMGCIGMGQAPAIGRNSLRTMPRNFPGRSGTDEDAVWLCSPETAAAAALTGKITDPASWTWNTPASSCPSSTASTMTCCCRRWTRKRPARSNWSKAITSNPYQSSTTFPTNSKYPSCSKSAITSRPMRSCRPVHACCRFVATSPRWPRFGYIQVDDTYSPRAAEHSGEHAIVGGDNYGQGSSREHAVIAPRYLGLRVVVAKSFARIHWQNLANFGVLALEFENPEDYDRLNQDDVLRFTGLHEALKQGSTIPADLNGEELTLRHRLSERQVDMVLAGGRIPHRAAEKAGAAETPAEEIRPIQPEG